MMGLFLVGILLGLVGLGFGVLGRPVMPSKMARGVIALFMMTIGLLAVVWSTTIYVKDTQGGVVVRKFGADLPSGKIIALNGEKGPQARVLPPGWHFGYWPWQYDLEPVENIDIPQGKIGTVTAKDGKSLEKGDVFAPEWDSPTDMLDAVKFLSGEGRKGPQLTVLPPGQYRYNPRLFQIQQAPALNVPVGSVAVVKANAGPRVPKETEVEVMNGVPIVERGFRGIWKQALTPNQYYMHPYAYEIKFVKTTKRVYTYSKTGAADNSIGVRTSDGYEFPVDVRVSVKVSAEKAPFVVAMLGDPDSDVDKDGFDVLEEIAILPSIRSIFRNSAEMTKGLQYVNSRSKIETASTTAFTKDMSEYEIDVDKVYVADIRLGDTPEGKSLLSTQTDKELAVNQQETYLEQVKAEQERAKQVSAAEEANQKKAIAAAAAQEMVEEGLAKAAIARADGLRAAIIKKAEGDKEARLLMAQADAEYNAKMVESLGGPDNYTKLQLMSEYFTAWKDGGAKVPHVNVSNGGEGSAGSLEGIFGMFMSEQSKRLEAANKQ